MLIFVCTGIFKYINNQSRKLTNEQKKNNLQYFQKLLSNLSKFVNIETIKHRQLFYSIYHGSGVVGGLCMEPSSRILIYEKLENCNEVSSNRN